jgi:hypothetical protein
MVKLFRNALTLVPLSVCIAGGVELALTSTPAKADAVIPLYAPPQEGCQTSRIHIPTGYGLQWYQATTCTTED